VSNIRFGIFKLIFTSYGARTFLFLVKKTLIPQWADKNPSWEMVDKN